MKNARLKVRHPRNSPERNWEEKEIPKTPFDHKKDPQQSHTVIKINNTSYSKR